MSVIRPSENLYSIYTIYRVSYIVCRPMCGRSWAHTNAV